VLYNLQGDFFYIGFVLYGNLKIDSNYP
jgi:hypothetical protein